MKIAIDARIISISTGRYVERLLSHLQKLDRINQYYVLLLDKDFDGWTPAAPNFQKVRADFPIYTFREQIQLAALLYKIKPDLVHFTMPQQPLLYFRRHVTTVHDLTLLEVVNKRGASRLRGWYKNNLKPAIFRLAMRRFVASSRTIITPTNYVKQQIVKTFGTSPAKIVVTYESVDPLSSETARPASVGEHDRFLFYLGNAYPYKNVWRVIEAFHKLNRPDLKLVLAGKKDYFYEGLQTRVTQAGIKGVIFTGWISDKEAVWLFRHSQAFITASLLEGFGLPALEAMYYGLPVLSGNASCLPEVYGEAAEYFNPLDVGDIVKKTAALLDNPARLAELRRIGPQYVKKYSWENMAHETLDVYLKAIGVRSQL